LSTFHALFTKIRVGQKCLVTVSTLTYYGKTKIMIQKSYGIATYVPKNLFYSLLKKRLSKLECLPMASLCKPSLIFSRGGGAYLS